MTGLDHETTAAVDQAAAYLASLSPDERRARPAVPMLKERFGLSAVEACQAIREAHNLKGRC